MPSNREWLIRAKVAQIKSAEKARAELRVQLREARVAGATVAQLIEWTGYSRRTIFYMLKENTK